LHGQFAVSFLDLCLRGIPGDSQNAIVIFSHSLRGNCQHSGECLFSNIGKNYSKVLKLTLIR
jgi:hypothetical protein